ncbi:MAG: helix-turn-helix transcriptional regulator [Oscillospiraceae bacterium]|nr:helix-turn-helix transcriptional regulator [Oscillospiraceae bacterium]
MNIKLGEKIRALRKAKNISQEVLAQYLGVSFQAVSKWENGDTMPDVTMIPAIAIFFDVSTDELFDFNRLETEQKIQEACWKIATIRDDEPEKAEKMLRDLLKQYPGNEIILNNLLYTMREPERSEEVVTLCKSILEVAKEDDVRYDVLRILAETYHEMGQQNLVKPTLEWIPEIYFSKLELASNLLDGDDALDAAQKQANISRHDLIDMLSRVCQLYHQKGQPECAAQYAAITKQLYDLFADQADALSFHTYENAWFKETILPRLGE